MPEREEKKRSLLLKTTDNRYFSWYVRGENFHPSALSQIVREQAFSSNSHIRYLSGDRLIPLSESALQTIRSDKEQRQATINCCVEQLLLSPVLVFVREKPFETK